MNDLKLAIKAEARQLGFTLAGVTSSDALQHFGIFEAWLGAQMHGDMHYLADAPSRTRRADPRQILPECKSILVLATPYAPASASQVASYAFGADYHDVLAPRLRALVAFIEAQLGQAIPNRYYTDSGPLLERELAQRAGLGWIGKNSCLIHPHHGSTFFLSEILLGIELEPDDALVTDQCGTCTRCLDACPTQCILPNRTLDARRCISYLTIEHKGDIDESLRPMMGDWIFGCDVCQSVCPWNRFAGSADAALDPIIELPVRTSDLALAPPDFNRRFKHSPIKRAKRRGYLRNLTIALGNRGSEDDLPSLEAATRDTEPMVQRHAVWAIQQIRQRNAEEQTSDRDK